MTDSTENEHLEMYKLHAELADRVSHRREGANRLYVSLLVGLMVFLAALIRFGVGDAALRCVLIAVGVSLLLSASACCCPPLGISSSAPIASPARGSFAS